MVEPSHLPIAAGRRRVIAASRRRLMLSAFVLFCASPSRAVPPVAEQVRIDRLIDTVANQKGAKFVRNGTVYAAADAARFMRGKLGSMGARVLTASEFIEQIATRSSTTGKLYTIQFADGHTLPAAEFLKEELRRMDAAK